MVKTGSLRLPSSLDSIPLIEQYVEGLKADFNIDESVYGNMLLAVVEAATNAIVHGNKEDCCKCIRLESVKEKNHLRVSVSDEGCGFDLNEVPDPTLPENLEKFGGRGVFLIQQLADDVDFAKNGATVEMMFFLHEN